MIVPFSPPDISTLEIINVDEVLKSGWITTGPKTEEFERKLAEFCHVSKAACFSSQTASSEMALHLLEIGPGDEVIVPAYTYTATVSVIYHVGAKAVMIDSQKDNLEMDYEKMADAINEHTKAIIPVDLAGVPCDYEKIYEIVESKRHLFKAHGGLQEAIGRVVILADTAHALGAKWHDKMVGSVADFSSFSMHAVKNLTTGEGGLLTWKTIDGIENEKIYRQLHLYSLHGQSKDALAKTQPGGWEYDIVGTWYKCNMTDITAAIGVAQLSRYPGLLERRREIIGRYDAAFRPLGIKTLNHYCDTHKSSGHLYITRIPGIDVDQRNEIIIKMAEQGISCNVHYKPLPMMTAYKNLGFDIKDYPNAYEHYKNEITLPLHTCLTDAQVDYVINNYTEILKEYL